MSETCDRKSQAQRRKQKCFFVAGRSPHGPHFPAGRRHIPVREKPPDPTLGTVPVDERYWAKSMIPTCLEARRQCIAG
jgi:hypothetical protein